MELKVHPPMISGNQLGEFSPQAPAPFLSEFAFDKRNSPPNLNEWEFFVQVTVSLNVYR
jgi:hypothetical protein